MLKQAVIDKIKSQTPSPMIPEIKEFLKNRGFADPEMIQLLKNPCRPHDPKLMHDSAKAVEIIQQGIQEKKRFMIVGDYDLDGIAATSIMQLGLEHAGAVVDRYIPDRFKDGYGLSMNIVDKIKSKTDILITVDNGIAAVEAVAYAKKLKLQVIVTDHHTPQSVLPDADALVHPALPGTSFREISGATVAYKLMLHLLESSDEKTDDESLKNTLLQYAALSIVSDVMPIASNDLPMMKINENRWLLKEGLNQMNDQRCDFRLKILFKMLKIDVIDETAIGFTIAPTLNATGRLANADHGVQLLTAKQPIDARKAAAYANYLNQERKAITAKMVELFSKTMMPLSDCLVVADDNMHEGLSGLIAGRFCKNLDLTTIVFAAAETESGSIWKGSARSNGTFDLYKALETLDMEEPGLLVSFGGHAGAAGVSIRRHRLADFKIKFNGIAHRMAKPKTEDQIQEIQEDHLMMVGKALKEYKPFGEGFRAPVVKVNTSINQLDLFYSSGHAKVTSVASKIEYWFYNDLEKVLNLGYFDGFKKINDNLEKKISEDKLTYEEALAAHWERWTAESKNQVIRLNIISELDYGTFMNNTGPQVRVVEYGLAKPNPSA